MRGARPPLRAYLAPPSVAACVAVTTRRTLCVFDVATGQRRYCSARGEAYTALAQLGSSSLIIVVPRTMPRCVRLINTTDGAVLLHAHGQRCLTHSGAPVTGGVKYLLRTDVVYQ